MLYSARILVVVFIVLVCPGAYACSFPDPVPIPDGATATEREMIAADFSIKRYMSRMQAYAECVKRETRELRSRSSRRDIAGAKSREERAIDLLNEAAAAMENVAELFNEAIAVYKERGR